MDEDDPELSCFCLVSSEDYHCQVISITGSVSLITFYVRASMQRVQLLIETSAGMPSRLAMIFLVRLVGPEIMSNAELSLLATIDLKYPSQHLSLIHI